MFKNCNTENGQEKLMEYFSAFDQTRSSNSKRNKNSAKKKQEEPVQKNWVRLDPQFVYFVLQGEFSANITIKIEN